MSEPPPPIDPPSPREPGSTTATPGDTGSPARVSPDAADEAHGEGDAHDEGDTQNEGVASDDDGARVVVAVIRSGGIAGLRRRWRVETDAENDDAAEWIDRIDRCPWNDDVDGGPGADRFIWTIRARTPSERRERDIPDGALDGPWRELVEAVRAAARA